MADARKEISVAFDGWQTLCKDSQGETVPHPPPPPISLSGRSRRTRASMEVASSMSVSSANSSPSETPRAASPVKREPDMR